MLHYLPYMDKRDIRKCAIAGNYLCAEIYSQIVSESHSNKWAWSECFLRHCDCKLLHEIVSIAIYKKCNILKLTISVYKLHERSVE